MSSCCWANVSLWSGLHSQLIMISRLGITRMVDAVKSEDGVSEKGRDATIPATFKDFVSTQIKLS